MLHPAMLYGAAQERNIHRLLSFIRRFPVLPVPGGGRHLVQPIHVDDVAACLAAAVKRNWSGSHVIPIAGPKGNRVAADGSALHPGIGTDPRHRAGAPSSGYGGSQDDEAR